MVTVNTELVHLVVTIAGVVLGPIFLLVMKSIVAEGIRKVENRLSGFTLELEKRLGKYEVDRMQHITESQTQHTDHNRRLAFLESAYERINQKMDTQKELLNKVASMAKAARLHQEPRDANGD